MKILITTQKVDLNDDVLGFFHDWIAEFAKHCESVTVICLYKGEHSLPKNVNVLSLGKEENQKIQDSMLGGSNTKLKYIFRFYRYIFQEQKNYDSVFIHMNQIYVLMGWPLWALTNKKVGLWYAHGNVSLSLRIAEKLSALVFTSTRGGFRINSDKTRIVGQGIDCKKFVKGEEGNTDDIVRIITVGRISKVKDYETLINAAAILNNKFKFKISIVGGPAAKNDDEYFKNLKDLVIGKKLGDKINFAGPIPNKEIAKYLTNADIFVNMSHTGSLDKAILEAMASGLLVLTCNEALGEIIKKYQERLFFKKKDANDLADKIITISKLAREERVEISDYLASIVSEDHSLEKLVNKILANY